MSMSISERPSLHDAPTAWLSSLEAAERLRASLATIGQLAKRGRLRCRDPFPQPHIRLFVHADDVEYIRAQRVHESTIPHPGRATLLQRSRSLPRPPTWPGMTIGERIRSLRLWHGLTQVELAALLTERLRTVSACADREVSGLYLAVAETGRRRLRLDLVPHLAALLGVSAADLFRCLGSVPNPYQPGRVEACQLVWRPPTWAINLFFGRLPAHRPPIAREERLRAMIRPLALQARARRVGSAARFLAW